MLESLKKLLYKWYSSDTAEMMEYVHPYVGSGIKKVAAGDPSLSICTDRDSVLPEHIELQNGAKIRTADYEIFDVEGASMSPEDICSGDYLLCQAADINKLQSQFGEFAVIEVDPEYYKWKNKPLKFDYKLRKTAGIAPKSASMNKIIDDLSAYDDNILLPANRECLQAKLAEARTFYKDEDLMISITYKNGELRYSLHPLGLVRYVGVYRISVVDSHNIKATRLN